VVDHGADINTAVVAFELDKSVMYGVVNDRLKLIVVFDGFARSREVEVD